MWTKIRNLFRRKAPQAPSEILRVGGRLVDSRDWSPEVVQKIRDEYFMPNLKDAALIRVDLSAACPEGHRTTERVGVFCKKGDVAKRVTDELHKIRIRIQCTECGKQAPISGRHIAWAGDIGQWDGAT